MTHVTPAEDIDFAKVPSPCFLLDEGRLRKNLELIAHVQKQAGCTIILALKAFANWSAFPIVAEYLRGATASSLNEALLVHNELGAEKELHVYAPAYSDAEFERVLPLASHITFNSFSQWARFRERAKFGAHSVSCGIRVNPEHSEVGVGIYNACTSGSRLGTTRGEFRADMLDGIDGLHFHNLCESGADALERTVATFEEKFGEFIPRMKWVNLGGGHLITREGYDVEKLIDVVRRFKARWGVDVILEPGEAIGWRTGWLVSSVLDVTRNGLPIALLDVSVSAHMPDCLEMPYRPTILSGAMPDERAHTYRIGGSTCLAGDVIGDYSFDAPLQVGTRLVFDDMIHYTMVKTTFFNGVQHPSIAHRELDGTIRIVRDFGYEDFKARLG